MENDWTCAAIGEFRISRAPAAGSFAVLNMAHGLGVGLVTDGDVYRGSTANVGEIGHMVLDIDGPQCPCGARGCLELLASPPRIVDEARHVDGLTDRLGIGSAGADMWEDYERIASAAVDGDADALARNVHETAVRLSESAQDSSPLGPATLVIHQQLGGFRRAPGSSGNAPTAAAPNT